jgi:hypothetical protein
MQHEDDGRGCDGEANEAARLRTTITHLVRQQDEQLDWLRRVEETLRATRESMLVYESGSGR